MVCQSHQKYTLDTVCIISDPQWAVEMNGIIPSGPRVLVPGQVGGPTTITLQAVKSKEDFLLYGRDDPEFIHGGISQS